jgi:hypothetical protein
LGPVGGCPRVTDPWSTLPNGTGICYVGHVDDTSSAASRRYAELLRHAGPQRRLQICVQLSSATRELAIAGIRQAHVDRALTDGQVRRKLAERLYGEEVAHRLFKGAGR